MNRKALVALLLVALLAFGGWFAFRERQAQREAKSVGIEVSRTLTARFTGMSALKVGTVNGTVMASSDSTALFGTLPVVQRTRAPYSVDYFVDLSNLPVGAYRWNERARTMSIELPDVTAAAPNIDMARSTVDQRGLYIPRAAGIAMQREAAERATSAARKTAQDPRFMSQARANARRAVTRLVEQPLRAAGLGDVRVAVRFKGDPTPAAQERQMWDESTPLSEILAR